MPLRKKDKQIRKITVVPPEPGFTQKDIKSDVIQGDFWGSGYDERLNDELIFSEDLPVGTYIVSFYPVGLAEGSDAITKVKIECEDGGVWNSKERRCIKKKR